MEAATETATTPTTPGPKPKKLRLELPVPLTDHEQLEIARGKARLEQELEEKRGEFADVKREWSEVFEGFEKRIAQAGAELRTGEQKRVVECHERYVREGEHAGKVEVVRNDTNVVVERRVANLLEARRAVPPDEDEIADDILADAARLQSETAVEETPDGDVTVPDAPAPKKRGRKPGKAKR